MAAATKKATARAEETIEQNQDNMNSMIALGQEGANVALNGMVQTAQIANGMMQNMVNVSMNAQEAGLNVARNYFDNMNRISNEMIGMFARTGERTINRVSDMEIAVSRQANDTAQEMVDNAEKAVDAAEENGDKVKAQAKAAGR